MLGGNLGSLLYGNVSMMRGKIVIFPFFSNHRLWVSANCTEGEELNKLIASVPIITILCMYVVYVRNVEIK